MQKVSLIPFTQEGYVNLMKEKETLLMNRPGIVDELRRAREMGDLSENGAYKGARMALSSLDARLRHLTYLLRYAVVVTKREIDFVAIGSTVSISNKLGEITYHIVGEHESNPSQNKISGKSPLGNALIGKKIGDTISFRSPKGSNTYIISKIW